MFKIRDKKKQKSKVKIYQLKKCIFVFFKLILNEFVLEDNIYIIII